MDLSKQDKTEVKFAKHLAKKLDSPTSLTEFAPLGSDEKPSGSHFFSRLFGRNKTQKTIIDISQKLEEEDVSKENESSTERDESGKAISLSESASNTCSLPDLHNKSLKDGDMYYGRSVSSVIRRISGLLDRRNTMDTSSDTYRDSDFKQYWAQDSNCKECYECGDKFTTFRRRHHCRICGQIFCNRCCNQGIPGKVMGYSGDLRVCTYCCKVVLSYIQSLDTATELSGDLRALQEDLAQKLMMSLPDHRSQASESNRARRKSSTVGFREEDIARAKFINHSEMEFSVSTNDIINLPPHDRRPTPQDENSLREIWLLMKNSMNGLDFQSHRHRLRTYNNCVVGSAIVDWIIQQGKALNRSQASTLAQSLMDAKILCCVTNDTTFFDGYALYQTGEMANLIETPGLTPEISPSPETHQESHDPLWLKEIQATDTDIPSVETDESIDVTSNSLEKSNRHSSASRLSSSSSTFYLDLDVKESRVTLSRPSISVKESTSSRSKTDSSASAYRYEQFQRMDTKEDILKGTLLSDKAKGGVACDIFVYNSQMLQENSLERDAYDSLGAAYDKLEQNLLHELLSADGLPLSWCETILPIIHRVTEKVRPDLKNDNDDMDIRQYVQIKKIPGGNKNECCIIRGVVCTKNVAHKKMKEKIVNPTILLLSSAIVYQRVENKLSSLDPILMQEFEYLKNTIGKISVYKPDILLVEKTVSRLAQEMLLELGITVALNTKPSVMERVARCTQAGIVSSIDAHLGRPQLGICHQFLIQNYRLNSNKNKTLMFFDGCASNLGCTVILRGGSASELRKVKKIIHFMIYVSYNWRLERSFLMDESALPPPQSEDLQLILESIDNATKTDDANKTGIEVELREKDAKSSRAVNSMTESLNSATEEERKPSKTYIEDFSDPLRCYIDKEDENVFKEPEIELHVESLPFSNDFRKALDDVILCFSPNTKINLPYLETEAGRNCQLRRFFPEEIFWSNQFTKEIFDGGSKRNTLEADEGSIYSSQSNNVLHNGDSIRNSVLDIAPYHPFVNTKLTRSFSDSLALQALLSDFRARGGRIRNACVNGALTATMTQNSNAIESKTTKTKSSEGIQWEGKVDALSPYHHQRLAVLFCSYSPISNNTPNFCVSPWVVNMDFYGRNDIPLGGFLERYCFRSTYVCPNSNCDTPMTAHIRKFTHDSGCVQIYLDKWDTDIPACKNHILMWSWCKACKETTPVVAMSQDTWSLSFGKYLELRFHAASYGRRGSNEGCPHSLHHEHIQYYAYQELVVTFKYHPISMREVCLPPLTITIQDSPIPLSMIVEEIKTLAVKGYGIYSNILEHLFTLKTESQGTKHEATVQDMMEQQEVERSKFRERIEAIQLNLTSPTLENKHISSSGNIGAAKDVCNLMWKIADSVVLLKVHIAEAVFSWNSKIVDFVSVKKKEEKVANKSGVLTYSRASSSSGLPVDASLVPGLDVLSVLAKHSDEGSDPSSSCNSGSTDPLPNPNWKLTSTSSGTSSVATPSAKLEQSISSIPEAEENSPCKASIKSSDKLNISGNSSWNEISSSDLQDTSMDFDVFEKKEVGDAKEVSSDENFKKQDNECKLKFKVLERIDVTQALTENALDPAMTTSRSSSSLSSYTYGTSPGIYTALLGQVPERGENESSGENVPQGSSSAEKKLDSSSSKGHERSKSDGAEKLLESFKSANVKLRLSEEENSSKTEKKERGSMKNLISQLLSTSAITPIPSPFLPSEHLSLLPSEKVPVVVYDNEPGSIIAYVLASNDYEQQLVELKTNINSALINSQNQKEFVNASPTVKKKMTTKLQDRTSSNETLLEVSPYHPKKTTGVLSFFRGPEKGSQFLKNVIVPSNNPGGTSTTISGNVGVFDAVHYAPSRSEREIPIVPDEDKEEVDFSDFALCSSQEMEKSGSKTGNKCANMHIECQFSDSTTRFYCRVYFAEPFRKLRTVLFPGGEERFIRSMSRCIPWMARGGKSGSTFCKTHDDRFILKQMSRLEVLSFMEFAPYYFQYINRACSENKPTVLAKIVGVYRIGFKNTATNSASKLDLLVMENLFYGRNISQKFDLKGSVRNRLVPMSDQEGEDTVLLDENLLKLTCENPLYIRAHSKTVLTLAINNDTQFLANHSVMDYSLLVGLDEEKNELVVGIIDYIRTFTWDKKLEMVVKSTGILGGHGKLPTVVYPEVYKMRFCEAMDHYFLLVPDQWCGLGRGLDS